MHTENLITILLIAAALAMDAFAVSISSGIIIPKLRKRYAFKIAFFFGFFQALMPCLGWLAGIGLRDFIQAIDHYVAFGLLGFIGIKMIYESLKKHNPEKQIDPLHLGVLMMLSVATSIDALAVGLSFAFLSVKILKPAVIIGVVTFIISFTGVFFGDRLGNFFKNKVQIVGGLILIGIGIKIFAEHVVKGI